MNIASSFSDLIISPITFLFMLIDCEHIVYSISMQIASNSFRKYCFAIDNSRHVKWALASVIFYHFPDVVILYLRRDV